MSSGRNPSTGVTNVVHVTNLNDSGVYTIDGERYCKDVNYYYGSDVT